MCSLFTCLLIQSRWLWRSQTLDLNIARRWRIRPKCAANFLSGSYSRHCSKTRLRSQHHKSDAYNLKHRARFSCDIFQYSLTHLLPAFFLLSHSAIADRFFFYTIRRLKGKAWKNVTLQTIGWWPLKPGAKHILSPLARWLSAFTPAPLSALKYGRNEKKESERRKKIKSD